jgi:hypothetical protein
MVIPDKAIIDVCKAALVKASFNLSRTPTLMEMRKTGISKNPQRSYNILLSSKLVKTTKPKCLMV